jgi:hypothetical protein
MVMVRFCKSLVFVLALSFLILNLANAQELMITREVPAQVNLNQDFTVNLVMTQTDLPNFDVSEFLPQGWTIASWSINGNNTQVTYEIATVEYLGKIRESNIWKFRNQTTTQITITYTIKAITNGAQEIVGIWIYPGNFGTKTNDVFVGAGAVTSACGNGICEALVGENALTCAQDCKFVTKPYIWVAVLILALSIIIAGLAYREYRKYGFHLRVGARKAVPKPIVRPTAKPAARTVPQRPVPVRPMPQRAPARPMPQRAPARPMPQRAPARPFFSMPRVRPAAPVQPQPRFKARPAKERLPQLSEKPKVKKFAGDKHTKFYKKTLKKLEKIREELE